MIEIQELYSKGWLHLSNVNEDNVEAILNMLGDVIYTTDVVVKPESKGLVTSSKGLDYHTDHHKAKYILWYCYKQTDKGGDSILIDAENIFSQLSETEKEELHSIKLFEHKLFEDDQTSNPLVETDKDGKRKFYYSFWLVKEDDKQCKSLVKFQTLLKESVSIKLNLKEKDILVVDNHRVFHGRTPIEGSKDRYLKRFWLSGI